MAIVICSKSAGTVSEVFRYTLVKTKWGTLGFISKRSQIHRLVLPDKSYRRIQEIMKEEIPGIKRDDELFPDFQQELADYFEGNPRGFDCRIDLSWASDFGKRVLKGCLDINISQKLTYGELAAKICCPRSARAVGRSLSLNRTPLIIPCHRVVAAGGKTGGYSAKGGIELKRRLLEHEARLDVH